MKSFNHISNSGFSLIEVMMATTIMTIGVLGLVSVSNSVVKGNSLAGNRSDAIVLIQDKLEELTYLDFSDPQLSDDADGADLIDSTTPDHIDVNPLTVYLNSDGVQNNPAIDPSGAAGQGDSNYTRFWNIADTSLVLKTIAVTVTWSDLFGSHTITLTTLKAK